MNPHPTTRQITALRGNQTQEAIAALVGVTIKEWRLWEAGLKPMPVRLWRRLTKPPPEPPPTIPPPKVTHAPTTSTVKALRLAYGCKRYQIAQFVGVHPDTWGKWEKSCPPSPRKWGRVLEALEGQPKLEVNMETESKTQTNADPARIKMYREAAGYDRKGAAALIDASEHTWKAWELGKRPMKQSLLDEWAAKATAIGNAPEPTNAAYVAPELKPIYFRPQGDKHVTVPGAIVILDDMTPEQEAEMEKDLMTPVMYDPREKAKELAQERKEQEDLREAAGKRALALAERDQKLLEGD